MVITIDGPAGAGKSTVARALARHLGFRFLDTGAMYRAVALAGVRSGIPWNDADALARLARQISIDVSGSSVLLDGEDVTDAVRSTDITSVINHVADNPRIREHLVHLQRGIAADGDYVTEGRDQGTVVFPDARCKIFLTASPEERARRRMADLVARGEGVTFEQVQQQQQQRDHRDRTRDVGPLVAAVDAVEVCTDGLTQSQVVDRLVQIVTPSLE